MRLAAEISRETGLGVRRTTLVALKAVERILGFWPLPIPPSPKVGIPLVRDPGNDNTLFCGL